MKWKAIVGLIMVIASIFCMFMWENNWRDQLTLTEVLVPVRDIEEGEIISSEDLTTIFINPESRIENSLDSNESVLIIGKSALISLKAKQQLLSSYFNYQSYVIPEDCRLYVIPNDWIYSKSSFLETEKPVRVYTIPETHYLGSYILGAVEEYGVEIWSTLEDYYRIYESSRQLGFGLLFVEE